MDARFNGMRGESIVGEVLTILAQRERLCATLVIRCQSQEIAQDVFRVLDDMGMLKYDGQRYCLQDIMQVTQGILHLDVARAELNNDPLFFHSLIQKLLDMDVLDDVVVAQ